MQPHSGPVATPATKHPHGDTATPRNPNIAPPPTRGLAINHRHPNPLRPNHKTGLTRHRRAPTIPAPPTTPTGATMPKARPLTAYPISRYWAVFSRGARAPLAIPLTGKEAATLRADLYAFRRAAEAAPDLAAQYGVDVSVLRQVTLTISSEGLVAHPLVESPIIRKLDEVLGNLPETTSPAKEAEAALQRLMNTLKPSPDAGD